jgi:HAD superfamily hydrolase (TIGR01509 family)
MIHYFCSEYLFSAMNNFQNQSFHELLSPQHLPDFLQGQDLLPVALFDLDGVLIDTEPAYSAFWRRIGEDYFPENPNFASEIKGCSLVQIIDKYFAENPDAVAEIKHRLEEHEETMTFPEINGAFDLVRALRSHGVKTAVVTSSNQDKMRQLYRAMPWLPELFDHIFTAECVSHSKPAPDCYLSAAQYFDVPAAQCMVFEDSVNGLLAARRAGARVYGVCGSLSVEEITPLCDVVVDKF